MRSGRPPWVLENDEHRKWFREWTEARLDERLDEEMRKRTSECADAPWPQDVDDAAERQKYLHEIDRAIARRDVEELVRLTVADDIRRLVFGRFLQGRGRPRGSGMPIEMVGRLMLAAELVKWTREIWAREFPGQGPRRSSSDGCSAEDIVVGRMEAAGLLIDKRALQNHLKHNPFIAPEK